MTFLTTLAALRASDIPSSPKATRVSLNGQAMRHTVPLPVSSQRANTQLGRMRHSREATTLGRTAILAISPISPISPIRGVAPGHHSKHLAGIVALDRG